MDDIKKAILLHQLKMTIAKNMMLCDDIIEFYALLKITNDKIIEDGIVTPEEAKMVAEKIEIGKEKFKRQEEGGDILKNII